MSGKVIQIEELPLQGTSNGKITIDIIEQPYGEESASVVSIGITLQSESNEPDWKVHIPKENIDEVISSLKRAKAAL